MKPSRATVIPGILALYLVVMACIGYPGYADGQTSALRYYGIISITVVILILLHFSLKRRDRLRRERIEDMEKNNEKK